jgi:YD repeat-containing protein
MQANGMRHGPFIFNARLAAPALSGASGRKAFSKNAGLDAAGRVTQWAYDVYGRQISKTDGNGVVVETNAYNANGKMTAHWTPAKGLTHYTYDANGNRLTTSFGSGAGISATYDSLNRLQTMTDAVGISTFAYRGFGAFMGALASEDGPWASDTLTNTYGANYQLTMQTLTQPSGVWSETMARDSIGRLKTLVSPAGTFTYNYSGAGREIQSLTLPGNNSIAMTYDDAGQLLTTALKNGGTVLDSYAYAYDANGRRISVQRADNSLVNYGYDNIGQLTGAVGLESGGVIPRGNENFGYQYDPAGNLMVRTNNTLLQTFTPDNANALVNITRNNDLLTVAGSLSRRPASLAINGQAATVYHDLTYAVTNGVSLVDGSNLLTAVVNGTMTNRTRELLPASLNLRSDLNGNLIWDGLKAYAYDEANELTAVTVTNAWQTRYAYDGLGRRWG